ncbi:MAG: hypothetical protein IJJ28_06155, partial [Lentisphaeria bacterium]|nr:hypothetical protein [Lentisphaeria bacterium]
MLKILVTEKRGIDAVAAAEFAKLWRAVTGDTLPVVTRDDRRSDLVVLGSDARNPFAHRVIVEKVIPQFQLVSGSDEYQLRSAADAAGRKLLFIAGGRPRALLYGVYRFFELRANCRYFWDGDLIPAGPAPDLTGLELKESPRFAYRGLRYFAHRSLSRFQAEHWDYAEWTREIDWLLKKRFNLFMLRIGIDDLFQKAFPEIVPYPKGYELNTSRPRSYDDHTLFWSLKYRSELRRKVLAYARERDLWHPEDVGTMTHWYSRTPQEYLDHAKPDFMPQSIVKYYNDPSSLVWDIRKDENLDAYWKLTAAHIREYGSPELFHTIGLAERLCYADRAANHQMKLYTYRRIQKKLREHYPNAPLLIASWDFVMHWPPEEVRDFIRELDPARTLILDYTSDTDDELRNFQNWNLCGKFPWIFGIFNDWEPNSEPRGNYDVIARRLEVAAADPMCRGMIMWPENSHSDTLMLEFLAANAWDPRTDHRRIETFLDRFCADRYGAADLPRMRALWRRMLPFIKARHWNNPGLPEELKYTALFSEFFFRTPLSLEQALTGIGYRRAEYFRDRLAPCAAAAPELLRDVARMKLDRAHEFVRRDVFDLLRTVGSRSLGYAFSRLMVALHDGDDAATEARFAELFDAEGAFTHILGADPASSLLASLRDLERKHRTNPKFEYTLKGNAENSYCRSFIPELFTGVYLPELEACRDLWRAARRDGTAPRFKDTPPVAAVADRFYATALAEFAPDCAAEFR